MGTQISAKQVEGMLKDVIMFTTQLNLNIIGFERPLLQQRGVTAGAMKSREIDMCGVQENIQAEVANAMSKLLHGNSGREFELQEWVTMFHQNMPLVCQQFETLLKGVLMMSGGSLPATGRYSYRASAARSRSPQQQSRSPSRKESSPSTRGFESGLDADLSNTAMIFEQVRSKAQSQPRDVKEEVREASRSPAGRSVHRDGSQERVTALLEKYSPPRSAPVVPVAEPVRAAPAASLRSWLAQHELTEWATALEREAVDLSTLTLLSDADLKDIGLPLGHRRRMLHAITQLEHDAAAVKPQVPLQQNNAEQIYRPMEAELKPASQPRSVSRSRSPQNAYAPMPEPDNYQEIYNVAEAAEADRIQQEIQQVSEQFEPESEAQEGKMMEMADGTIRMVSSPSKERPRGGSQSRSPPRDASPELGPRVGPRPPLEGQETRFDAGLLDLESDFEQITGKRFDPPAMKGTLKVKGLPNGLCVGLDQHRQALQTEKGRQAMYGAGQQQEGQENVPQDENGQAMYQQQDQRRPVDPRVSGQGTPQGMRPNPSPQRLHPAMVGRQGTPQQRPPTQQYEQQQQQQQQQQEIHPAMMQKMSAGVYQQGGYTQQAQQAVMQQQQQQRGGSQGAPAMQSQQSMNYNQQMASLVSQYEAQGGASAANHDRYRDSPMRQQSAFRC